MDLQVIQKSKITHSQLVKYAGASGDFNPIHTVYPVAKKAGLPDTIAHGMLVMGFAGEAIAKWFPRKNLRKFDVRFTNMTFPGERLSIYGKIVDEIERNGENFLVGEVMVKNEQDDMKLKGIFEVKKELELSYP